MIGFVEFQSTPLTRGETAAYAGRRADLRISIHSPHTRGDGAGRGHGRRTRHFNPLPSHEGRRTLWYSCLAMCNFNPLPSHEGRPTQGRYTGKSSPISIHSPHTRGDILQTASRFSAKFQSTPLTRGETISCRAQRRKKKISIHSPHTRGDVSRRFPNAYLYTYFNPLPSHEGRQAQVYVSVSLYKFQSTPLTRGETIATEHPIILVLFQSTPLTRGETGRGKMR